MVLLLQLSGTCKQNFVLARTLVKVINIDNNYIFFLYRILGFIAEILSLAICLDSSSLAIRLLTNLLQ